MYNDLYTKKYNKPQLHVDLDLPKFLMIIITVVGAFVLPAMTGTYLMKSNTDNSNSEGIIQVAQASSSSSEGKVAGASTSKNEVELFGVDFAKKENQLIGLGVVFLLLSIITVLYLLGLDKETDKNYTKSDVVW
jgi:hypothetical protein